MKITKRQLNKIIREELRMKPSKHGSLKIIKEGTSRVLNESSLQSAEEMAGSALGELLDGYLDQHLDLSGSNRMDALELAYQDLLNFVDRVIDDSKREESNSDHSTLETEYDHEDQHNDGTKLADMSSSWQQVLGSTRGYPK